MKKLFATILAVTMLISIITVPAFAETDNDLGIETIGTDDTQTRLHAVRRPLNNA